MKNTLSNDIHRITQNRPHFQEKNQRKHWDNKYSQRFTVQNREQISLTILVNHHGF